MYLIRYFTSIHTLASCWAISDKHYTELVLCIQCIYLNLYFLRVHQVYYYKYILIRYLDIFHSYNMINSIMECSIDMNYISFLINDIFLI
jgi:hypothetical protein